MDVKTLRERIAYARHDRHRVDDALQQAAVTFAARRNAAGVSWKSISAELGMSWHTLLYWRDRLRRSSGPRLARVGVVAEEPSCSRESFVVHTTSGLRIEQMSMQQLAELIARLR
jgi:hypothetical protein